MNIIEEQLREILGTEEIFLNEPLKNHTTFRIGGPADFYVVPATMEHLHLTVSYLRQQQIHHYILGKGSNVLFADEGYRGVVVEIGRGLEQISWVSDTLCEAEAGVSLAKLANEAAKKSLTGLEFASGIPGSLGGAITMNAGAYGGEMKDCLVSAKVLDQKGQEQTFTVEELKLSYRSSVIQTEQYLVLSAMIQLTHGDSAAIYETMKDFNGRRREKQPLEYPSAGSTFKRPEGYFAGKLIQDAGLRGYRVGDAMVSEKHCGFVVNDGEATASDVLTLIQDVQDKVQEQFGVILETEVRLIK